MGDTGGLIGWILLVVCAAVLGGAVLLGGCEARVEDARAERALADAARIQAEADKEEAQAQAFQIRSQAISEGADARADRREAARNASFERVNQMLPVILGMIAVLLLLGIAGLWLISQQWNQQQRDAQLLQYLQGITLLLQRPERSWRVENPRVLGAGVEFVDDDRGGPGHGLQGRPGRSST